MLLIVHNCNVQFNENGMKIMEQRCHNSRPLTTCGTNKTITTKTTTSATATTNLQQQQQHQQPPSSHYARESWQVLDKFVLKQIFVDVDNFNIFHSNIIKARDDDIFASNPFKNSLRLSLRHRSLFKNKLKRHRCYNNHKTPRLNCLNSNCRAI